LYHDQTNKRTEISITALFVCCSFARRASWLSFGAEDRCGGGGGQNLSPRSPALPLTTKVLKFLDPQTRSGKIYCVGNSSHPPTLRWANSQPNVYVLRWANDQVQPNRAPRGQRKQQMTTWRYQLFISSSREAEADDYQGLQDELNDLGQQGWELTAVTDAGDAKVFILKQPDENIVDPSAQA